MPRTTQVRVGRYLELTKLYIGTQFAVQYEIRHYEYETLNQMLPNIVTILCFCSPSVQGAELSHALGVVLLAMVGVS